MNVFVFVLASWLALLSVSVLGHPSESQISAVELVDRFRLAALNEDQAAYDAILAPDSPLRCR